jgi:hypothetical protein
LLSQGKASLWNAFIAYTSLYLFGYVFPAAAWPRSFEDLTGKKSKKYQKGSKEVDILTNPLCENLNWPLIMVKIFIKTSKYPLGG